MKAFDLHCHYNHGVEFDTVATEFHLVDLDSLKRERDRLDIFGAAVCSYASVLSDKMVEQENEHCFNLVQKEEWLYQWVVLDPRRSMLYKQVESILDDKKVLGIKIHSICHGYSFLDYANEVFSFAKEKNVPILIHPDNIIAASNIANEYGVRLINAHMGGCELNHTNAILTSKNKNIFTDTSGMASFNNNVVEYAVKTCGSQNIFFGTDCYSCAFQKGRIVFADISESDKENILFKNALREFPKIIEM